MLQGQKLVKKIFNFFAFVDERKTETCIGKEENRENLSAVAPLYPIMLRLEEYSLEYYAVTFYLSIFLSLHPTSTQMFLIMANDYGLYLTFLIHI